MLATTLTLLLAAMSTEPDERAWPEIPAAFLEADLQATINRGPAGGFPSSGCIGLVVELDHEGAVQRARIFRSTRIRDLDRGLLDAVSRYSFSVPRQGSAESQAWRVYVNYNQRGTRYQIAPACAPLRDDDGAYPERREDGSL
ncbi:hypothetical protein ARC20_08840 [Stenotrophomonas panacihumi]|uniref:TonB C-terminal domain-containing protein n=1 Tax=Stenotrophomonas panacihumi TaxID=676599 RepID=A0A0R0AS94_9GAMM|nr:hypothetical protein [Stenotrophomonas panacihumi]KRG44055.1 hypothetical protein ARC20_08840 [Stenotrophomonas panacihumi]PTN54290.1 hypothetical protein C9J98_10620 [Stenotrophomonas panacihumi]